MVCWAGGGRGKEALQRCEMVGLEQENTHISFSLNLVDLPHFSCDISVIPVMGIRAGAQWGVGAGVSNRGFMGCWSASRTAEPLLPS